MFSAALLLWPNVHRKHSLYHNTHHRKVEWKYPSDFQAPPFILAVGHWGSVPSPAWPDMDPYRRWPREALTLQPLWSCVWDTALAKSAEPEGRVGGQSGSIMPAEAVEVSVLPAPRLHQAGGTWASPKRHFYMLDQSCVGSKEACSALGHASRCSPMLRGGMGLGPAPTCTLLAWAELTWLHATSDCTYMPCNSLAQPLRQYLEKRSLAESCETILHWTGRPGTGRCTGIYSSSLCRNDERAKPPHCFLCQSWKV